MEGLSALVLVSQITICAPEAIVLRLGARAIAVFAFHRVVLTLANCAAELKTGALPDIGVSRIETSEFVDSNANRSESALLDLDVLPIQRAAGRVFQIKDQLKVRIAAAADVVARGLSAYPSVAQEAIYARLSVI